MANKQNNEYRTKLWPNCKTLSKLKCMQISFKKCVIWPVTGRVRYRDVSPRGACELGPKNNFCYRDMSGT